MDTVKKYGVVGILGLIATVGANAASVSEFKSGIVTGFGIAMMLVSIYRIAKATREDNSDNAEKNA